jgi:hypothetical protein
MTTSRNDPPVLVPDARNVDLTSRRDAAEIGVRLLDEAHTIWLIAECEVQQTLDAWREQGCGTRADRYRAYLAAVEREEAAARDLQRLYEIASPTRGTPGSAAIALGGTLGPTYI